MEYKIQDCIGARINGLARLVNNIYRKHLSGSGITQSQLSILMVLHKEGEVEQNVIGSILKFEGSSLCRNLVRLVEQNMVVKQGAVNRPVLTLTDKGHNKIKELLPRWENAMREIHENLGKQSIEAFKEFEKGFL